MIAENTFNPDRIKDLRKKFHRLDPVLLEKMLYALYLVEKLTEEKLNFIFKGGTSLILLRDEPRRFSIDVDIMTEESREKIENCLTRIVKNSRFEKFKIDEKRSYKNGINKAHYYIRFKSSIHNLESFILLDIIYVPNFYKTVKLLPIKSLFLETDGNDTFVQVPGFESITGDKITVFAPNTSGYLYKSDLELQIIKQLFDVGNLYNEITDFSEVADVFSNKVKLLNKYFKVNFSEEEILNDIIKTCLLLSRRDVKPDYPEKDKFDELVSGIKQISSFLIRKSFHKDEAIEFSAKTALIACKIKSKDYNKLIIPGENIMMNDYLIENQEYNFLNKLKNIPGVRSLFYWNQAIKLIS